MTNLPERRMNLRCRNSDCPTNTMPDIMKTSIHAEPNDSLSLRYTCNICNQSFIGVRQTDEPRRNNQKEGIQYLGI